MLDKLPPYLVNSKGELQETSNPRQPNVPYGHRHHSFLYPVFASHEFTPEQTPLLWTAARTSLQKKLAEHCEGSSFGRVHRGWRPPISAWATGLTARSARWCWKASGIRAS